MARKQAASKLGDKARADRGRLAHHSRAPKGGRRARALLSRSRSHGACGGDVPRDLSGLEPGRRAQRDDIRRIRLSLDVAGYRGLFDAAKRSARKSRAWNLDEISPVRSNGGEICKFNNDKVPFITKF